MAAFDLSQFDVCLALQGVSVPNAGVAELCAALRAREALFDRPRLRTVLPDETSPDELRLVLLREDAGEDLSGLTEEARTLLRVRGLEPRPHALHLSYEYWTAEHVLRTLLPPGMDVPTSFETVGHIAHLNLRDEQLPYKLLVGRVLLEKNAGRIKTVLNKVGTIDSEFRVPEFEVLAGDTCLETEVRQHGNIFRLDYGQVYWNSRLEHEHKRLVDTFKAGEVVCDMMAGIGPFAIPAARRRVTVHANDLNPQCAHYLRLNARLNKVEDRVTTYNMDARAFVRALAGGTPDVAVPSCCFDHVIMNLPASAVEFLDALAGSFSAEQWADRALPRVHCYAFLKDSETGADMRARVELAMGGALCEDWSMTVVRDVAPHKEMVVVSFRVPDWCRDEVVPNKRARVETDAR